ncbi:MAG: hypothetical protein PGN25_12025 [Methylorubrum populi]
MLTRLITAVRGGRQRSHAAARRLETARYGFERSLAALRKAALDHIDSQDLVSLTLRRCLDRCVLPPEAAA